MRKYLQFLFFLSSVCSFLWNHTNTPTTTKLTTPNPPSHLIVPLDGPELHHQLETQQVVGANGLQLQELTQSHQLRPLQVLQRQLILKQLRKPDNVLRRGLLACTPNLTRTRRGHVNVKRWNQEHSGELLFQTCWLLLVNRFIHL